MTTPQTFAVTVPHASSQLALGRCACPDGASLTTVGSVLADAAGTLTAQCDGAFLAQTNAAMSWLSTAGTQVHTAAGMTIYAGGGVAPGAAGAGAPASSPGSSKPGAVTEKVVNLTLIGANLARNAVDAAGAESAIAVAAQGLDAAKNVAAASAELGGGGGTVSAGAEMSGGALTLAEGLAKGDLAGVVVGAAGMASGAAGVAGGSDIEQRAVNEIKMVAGTMITGSATVGFDYKTLNKFGVTAGALTSFTTTVWGAFCLLKFEVKAGWAVKVKTKLVKVDAKVSATMDAKAALKIISPKIEYVSKLEVSKTLKVVKKTKVKSLEVKKKADLDGTLTVEKNMNIDLNLEVKKNLDAKADVKVTKGTKAKGAASVRGKTKVA